MKHALMIALFGLAMTASPTHAAETTLDVAGECRSIAESDLSGCNCQGLYFASKFGSEEGAAALHLMGRSYVPEPRTAAASLYDRFGADTLNRVAYRIMATRDEVLSYCPFSAHAAD
ncbi:hypothetical protein [Microvirga arabica]|uniref:Rap1a immunity protein domain-containing protein n=1 Tax=Microvirga arabica TaxID=1128671 RepID=A0ABV6Y4Q6_9HYPH|nr:hypothetical protein [Microvirga arabica]MBM1170920.1 hypothetical protein [Microvirga arabica]